jgi:hypothetical protein
MELPLLVSLLAAASGVFPLLLCALRGELGILLVEGAVTFCGVLHATTQRADGVAAETVNACAAVAFTLACAGRMASYRTIVGAFRTLWLVAVVTSSCGHASIRGLIPRFAPAIPNDLTIVAFGLGVVVIAGHACVAACRHRRRPAVRDGRVLAMEVLLVAGAFGVRYQSSLDAIAHMRTDAGWTLWYACCHATVPVLLWRGGSDAADEEASDL